jgi:hypothetical protein
MRNLLGLLRAKISPFAGIPSEGDKTSQSTQICDSRMAPQPTWLLCQLASPRLSPAGSTFVLGAWTRFHRARARSIGSRRRTGCTQSGCFRQKHTGEGGADDRGRQALAAAGGQVPPVRSRPRRSGAVVPVRSPGRVGRGARRVSAGGSPPGRAGRRRDGGRQPPSRRRAVPSRYGTAGRGDGAARSRATPADGRSWSVRKTWRGPVGSGVPGPVHLAHGCAFERSACLPDPPTAVAGRRRSCPPKFRAG